MAKEKIVRSLTEDQRERIRNTPGVVIRQRKEPPEDPFYVPKIRAKRPISASELIDWDDDYDDDPAHRAE